jgi:NitT/TauT family transport system permease protein
VSPLNEFAQAWVPNGHVSQRVHRVLGLGTVALLLIAWTFRPAFLPGPLDVLRAYPRLFDMGLAQNLLVSISTNIEAILITCVLTIPLAYLTVLPAVRPFVRTLSKARFLGLTGFVVLFTILFGGGHGLKVALLVFGMGVFQMTSLYDVVEAIPRDEFDHARTLRMGSWGSVVEVVILGHMDAVLDAIRQNAAMGWVMLTLVEGLVRFEGGLGVLMLAEDKHIQLDAVFAIQAVVLGIGILQDWAIVWIRRLLCPYASLTLERQ